MLAGADLWSLLSLTAVPLVQLLALVLAGIALHRVGILDEPSIDRLVRLVISVTLPCLMFSTVVRQFRPYTPEFARWYVLPLAAVGMVGLAAAVAAGAARWLVVPERRGAFRVVCVFHNAGYLNIPIVAALYGQEAGNGRSADQMLVILFLFILGISPLMWSVGVSWLRTDGPEARGDGAWRIQQMISPPFVANVAAVVLCLTDVPTRVSGYRLEQMLAPVRWTGECTIPLIMLTLGGILAGLRSKRAVGVASVLAAMGLRFVAMPLAGLGLLGWLVAHGLLAKSYAIILFLQTMMPTATGMAVAARRYGSVQTSEYVNGAVFILYVVSLVIIPFWLMVWGAVQGFGIP
jgi:predicted permease